MIELKSDISLILEAQNELNRIENLGYEITNIRVMSISRSFGVTRYVTYNTKNDFLDQFEADLNSQERDSIIGDFTFIDTIHVKDLSTNSIFKILNITSQNPKLTTIISSVNRDIEIRKRDSLLNSLNSYVDMTKELMEDRLNSYVDPNYVEEIYVSFRRLDDNIDLQNN